MPPSQPGLVMIEQAPDALDRYVSRREGAGRFRVVRMDLPAWERGRHGVFRIFLTADTTRSLLPARA